MFLLIRICHTVLSSCRRFNTSHVSINPCRPCRISRLFQVSIHLMFLLIFFHQKRGVAAVPGFNTSHVSINLEQSHVLRLMVSSFNTSHVSINRLSYRCHYVRSGVSIHLMFLLIYLFPVCGLVWFLFQYISCFY